MEALILKMNCVGGEGHAFVLEFVDYRKSYEEMVDLAKRLLFELEVSISQAFDSLMRVFNCLTVAQVITRDLKESESRKALVMTCSKLVNVASMPAGLRLAMQVHAPELAS